MKNLYKNIDLNNQNTKNILLFLLFSLIVISGVFFKISIIKSRALKSVSTLQDEYEKHGLPVFASKITLGKINFFSSISIEKSNENFVANIDRNIHRKIRAGSIVILKRDSKNIIKGRVTHISNNIDLDFGGYEIIVKFDSPVVLISNFESALIATDSKITIAVNNDNIGSDDSGSFVWVIKNNLLQKQYVKIGLEDGFKSEILSDLNPGDIIVTSDLKSLKQGIKARIVENIE